MENQKGIVDLPEQNLATFKYFLYWLHTKSLRDYLYPATTKPSLKSLEAAALAERNECGHYGMYQLSNTNLKMAGIKPRSLSRLAV